MGDRGWRIEDRGWGMEDRGWMIERQTRKIQCAILYLLSSILYPLSSILALHFTRGATPLSDQLAMLGALGQNRRSAPPSRGPEGLP